MRVPSRLTASVSCSPWNTMPNPPSPRTSPGCSQISSQSGFLKRVDDLHLRRAVPDTLRARVAGGFDRRGRLVVGVEAPEDDAHHVGAAVADHAAARFHDPAELPGMIGPGMYGRQLSGPSQWSQSSSGRRRRLLRRAAGRILACASR